MSLVADVLEYSWPIINRGQIKESVINALTAEVCRNAGARCNARFFCKNTIKGVFINNEAPVVKKPTTLQDPSTTGLGKNKIITYYYILKPYPDIKISI